MEELKSFRDLAEKFASKEIEPGALESDRYPFAPFNESAWKKAAEVGLATVMLPENLGGMGQGVGALCAVIETLGAVDAGVAAFFMSQAFAQSVIASLAPESVAKTVFAGGAPVIASPLYDLPDDFKGTVEARKDGDSYTLHGWAVYLAAAPVATWFIVPAKTSSEGMQLFLVGKDSKGVEAQPPAVSLGLRQLPSSDVGLDGVKVPGSHKMSAGGYANVVDRFRPAVTALALGVVEGSYETALDYAKERYQAKKMIIEHDMVRVMLAGMASLIDIGKPLVAAGCAIADNGGDKSALLSIQSHVTNLAARAATDGVQLLGGYGYMHDYGQEKRMRDAKQIQAIFGPAAVKSYDVLTRKLAG